MKRILSLSLVAALAVGLVAACDPAVETTDDIQPLDDTGVMMEETGEQPSEEMMIDESVEETDVMMEDLEETEMEEVPEEEVPAEDEMM
ncbi:MAG: hypothetical protein WDZ94_02380 [Patescibacteria group bacterium]